MQISRGQVYGGAFMIASGIATLLGRFVGFEKVWFLYPLVAGILMIVAPWATDAEQVRKSRVAGVWTVMGAVIAGLVILTGMAWETFSPIWLIGAGLTTLILAKRQTA
jgi:urea transporter